MQYSKFWSFCTDLCGDHSMKVVTRAQVNVWDIGRLLWRESFIFLYTNTFFPHSKSCSAQTWLPKSLSEWCHHLIHCLTCAVFTHPNTCYETFLSALTAHNCYSRFTQHTTNNEKMRPWVLAHRSFVTCALPHRVVKSCKVIICRHNAIINKQVRRITSQAVLQIGRSLVRSQLVSLEFFIDIKSPRSHYSPGSTQPLTEMSTRSISWT